MLQICDGSTVRERGSTENLLHRAIVKLSFTKQRSIKAMRRDPFSYCISTKDILFIHLFPCKMPLHAFLCVCFGAAAAAAAAAAA